MAKAKTVTSDDALEALKVLSAFVESLNGASASADEEEEFEVLDREEVEALGIKELRALAQERGIEEKKKADILAALDEGGHFGEEDEDGDEEEDDEEEDDEEEEADDEEEEEEEDEDEGDEDEDDDEEDEDEDEEGYSREELEELDLKELRKIAKENGVATKGLDQDAIIDALLGDEDEDEEDEEEEEEDEAEEEEVELDEDSLKAMSLKELRSVAKELEIKVKFPKTADTDRKKKNFLVKTILDSAEEEE